MKNKYRPSYNLGKLKSRIRMVEKVIELRKLTYTLQEISEIFGIKSKGTIHDILKANNRK
jgi:hypothetical protein